MVSASPPDRLSDVRSHNVCSSHSRNRRKRKQKRTWATTAGNNETRFTLWSHTSRTIELRFFRNYYSSPTFGSKNFRFAQAIRFLQNKLSSTFHTAIDALSALHIPESTIRRVSVYLLAAHIFLQYLVSSRSFWDGTLLLGNSASICNDPVRISKQRFAQAYLNVILHVLTVVLGSVASVVLSLHCFPSDTVLIATIATLVIIEGLIPLSIIATVLFSVYGYMQLLDGLVLAGAVSIVSLVSSRTLRQHMYTNLGHD